MKIIRYSVLAGIVAVFSISLGCVSYQSPPQAVNEENYTTINAEKHHELPNTEKELTLQETIRVALANNPNFKTAHYAMVAAWALYYKALATYSPQLSATFAGTQNQMQSAGTGTPSAVTAGANSVWEPVWAGKLAATWTVFDGLIREMNALKARSTVIQKEELERDYRRTLIQAVTLAYDQILLQKSQIKIDRANEIFQDQMVANTELKYQAGASSLADLLNYKIKKNDAQVSVLNDTALYQTYKYALAILMGLTTSTFPEETKFPDIKLPDSNRYTVGVDYYLDEAVARRPDLKAERREVDAFKYAVYAAWGAFSPNLNVSLNYGYSRSSFASAGDNTLYGSAVPRGQDLLYNYGLTASWLLWDGGTRIANVRYQQALLDQEQEALLSQWMTVIQDVRTSYTNLMAAIAIEKVSDNTFRLTKERRDLVEEEYLAGNVDVTRMNEAQNQFVSAESTHVKAMVAIVDYHAKLMAACGINDELE